MIDVGTLVQVVRGKGPPDFPPAFKDTGKVTARFELSMPVGGGVGYETCVRIRWGAGPAKFYRLCDLERWGIHERTGGRA